MQHYIGVDVGTGSARAAIVTENGHPVATAVEAIKTLNPKAGFYEQSSDDIWRAVVLVVNTAMEKSGVAASQVKGIGFDATCSLVALNHDFKPVSCSPTGDDDYNIVMWMDHRAEAETERINATHHSVLHYVGGKMSLEMQPPKLLWLKENLPVQWKKMSHLFDLPDYLTWRATGSFTRSLCSMVCKWSYEVKGPDQQGWNAEFLKQIGLQELTADNYSRIGNQLQNPGEACGSGLSGQAAAELGLLPQTAVGTSLIDAYAGAIACLGCVPAGLTTPLPPVTSRLALICGTSTCHMVASKEAVFVPGVWGPYYSNMIPGLWGNEGGQSATGKLIDFVIETHSAYPAAKANAEQRGVHVHQHLNMLLEDAAAKKGVPMSRLTCGLHVYPDFHGNRSPLSDASMKGMVCGLTLSSGEEDLAGLYLATVQALTYGTRHILEEMNEKGHSIQIVYLCGGLRKNAVFVQTHADVLGLPVILPDAEESVLLGAAILGACASGNFSDIQSAMLAMSGGGRVVMPDASLKEYHGKKYSVFQKMLADQRAYTSMMK